MPTRATLPIALLLSLTILGCGTSNVPAPARAAALAACRQSARAVSDPAARRSAEQACQAISSGNRQQITDAAIKAARQACLQEAQRIRNATTRSQVKATCPGGK